MLTSSWKCWKPICSTCNALFHRNAKRIWEPAFPWLSWLLAHLPILSHVLNVLSFLFFFRTWISNFQYSAQPAVGFPLFRWKTIRYSTGMYWLIGLGFGDQPKDFLGFQTIAPHPPCCYPAKSRTKLNTLAESLRLATILSSPQDHSTIYSDIQWSQVSTVWINIDLHPHGSAEIPEMNFAATNFGVLKRLCKDGAESRMEAKTAWKALEGRLWSNHVMLRCSRRILTLSRCPRMVANHSETQALAHTHTYPVQPVHPTKSFVSVKFNFREVFCLVAVYSLTIRFSTSATALTKLRGLACCGCWAYGPTIPSIPSHRAIKPSLACLARIVWLFIVGYETSGHGRLDHLDPL